MPIERVSIIIPPHHSTPLFMYGLQLLLLTSEDSSHQTNPIEWTRFNREYVAGLTRLLFDQICITIACDVNKVYPVRLLNDCFDI
jgi:hypothetical protein